MSSLLNDVLQAWDNLSGNLRSNGAPSVKINSAAEHAFITSTIIALGELHDSNIDDLIKVIQEEPVVVWNIGLLKESSSHLPLAPSYKTLFENFDKTVNHNGYLNVHPLNIETLTLSGLPTDEIPCVEIYDLNGLVFTSHQGDKLIGTQHTWDDEYGDGLFRISRPILGDFALIVRFGGDLATNKDKSTLIFKYQNSTAFIPPKVMSLASENVDINPQYADAIDVELFKVQILFSNDGVAEGDRKDGKWSQLPKYSKLGIEAFQGGLEELSRHHPLTPEPTLVSALQTTHSADTPVLLLNVALQLSNNNLQYSAQLLDMMNDRVCELTGQEKVVRSTGSGGGRGQGSATGMIGSGGSGNGNINTTSSSGGGGLGSSGGPGFGSGSGSGTGSSNGNGSGSGTGGSGNGKGTGIGVGSGLGGGSAGSSGSGKGSGGGGTGTGGGTGNGIGPGNGTETGGSGGGGGPSLLRLDSANLRDDASPSFSLSNDVSVGSNDSWEVVASTPTCCPVCKDANEAKNDQLVPCCLCGLSYHTWCVQLRKLPFSSSEEHQTKRENYLKTHYSDWRCPHCIELSKDITENLSVSHIAKNTAQDTSDLVNESGRHSPSKSIKNTFRSMNNINDASASGDLAMSYMQVSSSSGASNSRSRGNSSSGGGGIATGGNTSSSGGVIVTDKVRSMSIPGEGSFSASTASSRNKQIGGAGGMGIAGIAGGGSNSGTPAKQSHRGPSGLTPEDQVHHINQGPVSNTGGLLSGSSALADMLATKFGAKPGTKDSAPAGGGGHGTSSFAGNGGGGGGGGGGNTIKSSDTPGFGSNDYVTVDKNVPALASTSITTEKGIKMSNHDTIALLISSLSTHKLSVETLLNMDEKAQRETIIRIMSDKLDSEESARSLTLLQDTKGRLDLATAMRGIIVSAPGSGNASPMDGAASAVAPKLVSPRSFHTAFPTETLTSILPFALGSSGNSSTNLRGASLERVHKLPDLGQSFPHSVYRKELAALLPPGVPLQMRGEELCKKGYILCPQFNDKSVFDILICDCGEDLSIKFQPVVTAIDTSFSDCS
eukprot:gene23840-30115_t